MNEETPFKISPEDSIKNVLESSLKIVPLEEWDERVLPLLIKYNDSLDPKLEPEALQHLYTTVLQIELEKRSKPGVFLPAISFQSLSKRKFPPLRFCIEPFFEQGTVNMLTAPPNNWKSWLLFLFSYHIATGTPVLDKFNTAKSKVMIVNEEDSLRLIQDRYRILNITDDSLNIYFRVAHGAKLTLEWVKLLIAEAKRLEVTVIMFDSLRALNDANENDSQEMQKVMDYFKQIARENITVIFTHHNRKKSPFGKQDEAEASRGSTGINASISGHLSLSEVEREGDKYIVIQHLKSKVGEKEKPFEISIKFGRDEIGKVNKISFEYAGEFKKTEQKLNETKDDLMDILKPNVWVTLKELQDQKIGGVNVIRQALAVLVENKLVLVSTRKQLAEKYIKVSEGSMKEKLYSLNPETQQEEMSADEEFEKF